jgi:hypothetical protein
MRVFLWIEKENSSQVFDVILPYYDLVIGCL